MTVDNPSLNAAPATRGVFHAFLSHNGADRPCVGRVAEQLEDRGLSCWLGKWNLIPGDPWQPASQVPTERRSLSFTTFGSPTSC